jgi:hypothetical protein
MNKTPQELTPAERAGIRWRVSRHTTSTPGQCVEAGPLDDGSGRVAVRHSHHPDGDVIVYTQGEWEAFTRGVVDGDFDFA